MGRERSQKARRSLSLEEILSQALTRANAAVILDRDEEWGGAIKAYNDARLLLQQVVLRTSSSDERQKLEAIVGQSTLLNTTANIIKRNTYRNRIGELQGAKPLHTNASGGAWNTDIEAAIESAYIN